METRRDSSLRRPVCVRILTALVVGLLTLVGATVTATAAPEHPHTRLTLEGTWHASVTTSIPSEGETTLTFLPDGTLQAPDEGTWSMTSRARFTFTLRYERFDEEGNYIGYTEGTQVGTIRAGGERFSSNGTSTVYAADGTKETSFRLSIEATRT